jgi:hypothetical protein
MEKPLLVVIIITVIQTSALSSFLQHRWGDLRTTISHWLYEGPPLLFVLFFTTSTTSQEIQCYDLPKCLRDEHRDPV